MELGVHSGTPTAASVLVGAIMACFYSYPSLSRCTSFSNACSTSILRPAECVDASRSTQHCKGPVHVAEAFSSKDQCGVLRIQPSEITCVAEVSVRCKPPIEERGLKPQQRSENINKHLQEHQKDYVVTSRRLREHQQASARTSKMITSREYRFRLFER